MTRVAYGLRSLRSATATAALAAALVAAGGLEGQVVHGVVTDAETAEPVVLAYVGLLAPGRHLIVAGLADAEGRFSLTAPRPGTYLLYVSRSGYRPLMDGVFELGDRGIVEVAVGLTPAPVALEGISVEVEGRQDLTAVGFYDRMSMGFGHFLEREDIDRAGVDQLADALRTVPGVRVIEPVASVAPTELLNPEIRVRRGGEYCSPALYLDGHLMSAGSARSGAPPVRPDDFVGPSEVEGVEIYTRPAETPPRFEMTGGCGAVLIWTRVR